jgi:predicted short-subunit dehydrogenase-like oxidoreductase (DUF2520 family)
VKPTIGIIGTGKVGSTLARLWNQAGYAITAVYNRTPQKAEYLMQYIPSVQVVSNAASVVHLADIVVLCVGDDAISQVTTTLTDLDWRGKIALHTSGALSMDVLQGLADSGALIGSLHPAFPFADVDTAVQCLAGTTFAIEASHQLVQQRLIELVESINGQVLLIPTGKKALYHAALVLASNYTVTLYAVAETILLSLGAQQSIADNALNTLVEATVQNIRDMGIPGALTGPLSRADVGTIQSHLSVIDDETVKTVYKGLARLSFPMLRERGIDITQIEQVLQDDT